MKKPAIRLYGTGSAITDEASLKRRAKSKKITRVTMRHLVDVARERGANDRVQGYWNTYHCQNNLIVADGRIRAPFCRNRFCPYCCGVRKAELINKYLPEIRLWKDAHFVTLTRLAVPAIALPEAIAQMQAVFSQINARLKKRWQRGTGIKIVWLRALECNFNATLKTYNPTFIFWCLLAR
jgi:hypothetical protein